MQRRYRGSGFMGKGSGWVLAFLLLLGFPATTWATDSGLLQEARCLLQERKEQEALQVFERLLTLEPNHLEALCQASLLHSSLGASVFDETTRGVHYRAAEAYALQAVELKGNDPEANFAMATAYHHLCQVVSIRQKMMLLRDMKVHLDKVLALNANHAGAWHLLGRWHFRAANYSVSELLVTNVMMRGFAKEASNEKAEEAMEKAISLAPQAILYYYDLARIYHLNKRSEACVHVLNGALKLELVTEEELEINRKCKAMLRELKIPTT